MTPPRWLFYAIKKSIRHHAHQGEWTGRRKPCPKSRSQEIGSIQPRV